MGIAFYNLAVEYEHTNNLEQALTAYNLAIQMASSSPNTEQLLI